jgi:hypothetical protein
MAASLTAWLQRWAAEIQARHSVNPWIFLGLMTACAPFFYYSIYRLARAAALKNSGQMSLWSTVFLAAAVLPYLYIMAWGRRLPWYIYIVLAILIAQGVWSLLTKRKQSGAGGG